MELIDKDAVVAKIERKHNKEVEWMERQGFTEYHQGLRDGYANILSCLDTIKVKEVDLEKIINDYFKDWKFDDELDIMVKPSNYSASFIDLKEIAKYFFELGIKAQKLSATHE
jgi:uncharacterized protein (DUF2164 family)